MIKISIDAMGGDHGPRVTVPAAVAALRAHPNLHLTLVGNESVLLPLLSKTASDLTDRYAVLHADSVVAMDEPPSQAVRKKDSSMRLAVQLVKTGEVQACVSAGNTGALMATGRFVLRMLPGIDRPAIMTRLPTMSGKEVRMLDLGANIDSSAEHLYQFGLMASILTSAIDGIAAPKVGLLNIGEEDIKGNEQVKKTAELLSKDPNLNYIGYIEGNDIFKGDVDVVVCDGFVGNVTLKSCEGISKLINTVIADVLKETWWSRMLAVLMLPVFKKIKKRIDPRRRNGATFLGLDGILIKSHGCSKVMAFGVAIEEALLEVEKGVPNRIKAQLHSAKKDD